MTNSDAYVEVRTIPTPPESQRSQKRTVIAGYWQYPVRQNQLTTWKPLKVKNNKNGGSVTPGSAIWRINGSSLPGPQEQLCGWQPDVVNKIKKALSGKPAGNHNG
ncbi:TPA: hypothetical protein N2997_004315 [Salmonella enterica subsp. diarizonae serovar 48:i:z35]|nr:hypothetical protein [Salmonella enterica]HCM1651994.1 hypothetical protein [Salmonella enterica subsp. diarizonae serovar 48:i:z35]